MDTAPPASRNSYLVAIAIRCHLNPARDLSTPPPPLPAKPPGISETFNGVADCPAAAACVDSEGFVGGETCPGLLIGEPEGKLTPYQLVNGGHAAACDPVSTK